MKTVELSVSLTKCLSEFYGDSGRFFFNAHIPEKILVSITQLYLM